MHLQNMLKRKKSVDNTLICCIIHYSHVYVEGKDGLKPINLPLTFLNYPSFLASQFFLAGAPPPPHIIVWQQQGVNSTPFCSFVGFFCVLEGGGGL